MLNQQKYFEIKKALRQKEVTLVAVSKTKTVAEIKALYDIGQRDFGENYVQELMEKQPHLPADIRWHFIGHLQTNKVKYIAPFIYMIQSVDSFRLLKETNRQALKSERNIKVLLQVHIATEETKFGLDETELSHLLQHEELKTLEQVQIEGLMGMASFSDNPDLVRNEMRSLHVLYNRFGNIPSSNVNFTVLSMGMSSDYTIAIEEGSNMVRIGSLIFGERTSV